jgi:hypothetical protein
MSITAWRSPGGTAILTTVAYKIPEILRTRKAQDTALVLLVGLLGAVAFGLGRLSAGDAAPSPVLCQTAAMLPAASTLAPVSTPSATLGASPATADQPAPTTASYVASKSGSVYHLPWCAGAKRIKEENKVWFGSKAEAEAAGYRPASNCKGL